MDWYSSDTFNYNIVTFEGISYFIQTVGTKFILLPLFINADPSYLSNYRYVYSIFIIYNLFLDGTWIQFIGTDGKDNSFISVYSPIKWIILIIVGAIDVIFYILFKDSWDLYSE